MKAKIRITQYRSSIGQTYRHRSVLQGLGLDKCGRSKVLEDAPSIRGMIRKVQHLVRIERAVEGHSND